MTYFILKHFRFEIVAFLASGDFDIKIDTRDDIGPFSCVQIKFTVKQAPKPGK